MRLRSRGMKVSLETESSSSSSTSDDYETSDSSDDSEEKQQIDILEENRRFQLANQVFNQELLREMIIDYVIHDENYLSIPDIQNCRLVQKPWLHSVSKLHREQRAPLFSLHLDKKNSLELSTRQNGKLLDKFLTAALSKTSPAFADEHVPPFSVNATQHFFKDENYHNFRDILLKCGTGLVEMNLEIPVDGGSMSFLFPRLSLPNLTKFTVQFANETDDDDDDVGTNAASVHLIQSILNASHHSLKYFELPFTQEDTIPSGMEYLTLPVAMITLRLTCHMNSKDLRILLSNRLPNLKVFELLIPHTPFHDGLLSQALAPLSEKLEVARFIGVQHDGVPSRPTCFEFPSVMKKLKHLTIKSVHLELTNGLRSLETSLPDLNRLTLRFQTIPMIRKWMNNSTFENVRELRMSLVNANVDRNHEDYFVNVEVDVMQCLHLAYPNLKLLEITVFGAEVSGLEYLLLELNQLEDLEILVRRTENLLNSDVWDALLTGVTVEIATAMRTISGFPDFFEIRNETRPSIRNLTKLRRLKITTPDSPPRLAKVPLISDSVFVFGFLKMPNLRTLEFGGRFAASNQMRRKWSYGPRSQRRSFVLLNF